MPYKITNLASTRRDPHKRGRTTSRVKRNSARMRIGVRKIGPAETITINDSVYASNKTKIDELLANKLISLTAIGAAKAAQSKVEAAQIPIYAPSPEPPPPPSPAPEEKKADRGVVTMKMSGASEEVKEEKKSRSRRRKKDE